MKKYLVFISALFLVLAGSNVYSQILSKGRINFTNYSSCDATTCLIQVELRRNNNTIIGVKPSLTLLSENAQVIYDTCAKKNCQVLLKARNIDQQFKFAVNSSSGNEVVMDDFSNSDY